MNKKKPVIGADDGQKEIIMPEQEQNICTIAQEELQEIGLIIKDPIADGNLHRCGTVKDPEGKDGSYIIYSDKHMNVWGQNWQTGQILKRTVNNGKKLSKKEKDELSRLWVEVKRKAEEDRQKRNNEAAQKAQEIWKNGKPIKGQEHGYLQKKGVQSYGLRECDAPSYLGCKKALTMPILGEDGDVQSLQFIREDGFKRFLSAGKKKDGFFFIPAKDKSKNGVLYIAEGYSTAASIHEATACEVYIALDAGNLLGVAQIVRKYYPKREIVLCADFDNPNEPFLQAGGIGVAKATEAAKAIGGRLAIPDLDGQKADFNDLAQAKGLEEVAKQILVNTQKIPVLPVPCSKRLQSGTSEEQVFGTGCSTCSMPDGFYFVEDGLQSQLWHEKKQSGQNGDGTQKDPVKVYVGPRLDVIAQSRDGQSEGWSKFCLWHDPKGVEHRVLIPMSAVVKTDTSAWLEILASGGYFPSSEKGSIALLKKYLLEAKPAKFVRQVSRSGWHGKAFVLAKETIGDLDGEEVLFDGAENTAFAQAGTLEDWQVSIGEPCKGNSRLLFAVSAAFAAILLRPCDVESGGVVFVGDSSSGKTTNLQVSASVWGKGSESGGFLRTWRATANGLEGTASEFSDCLLCLDELGQVDVKELGEVVYMLANGQGKSRAKRNGDARKIKNWCSFVLSSGEVTVKQMIESAGKKAKAGQDVRLVCIPTDAGAGMGAFENLHSYPDAGSFAKALKAAACENYGHAAKAFIRAFQGQWEDTVRAIKITLSKGLSKIFPSEDAFSKADGQVLRGATRFLMVALAGENAAEWGIVPWEQGEALAAAKRCFSDWLEERGGVGAAEKEDIVHDVVAFLEQNGQSRFQSLEATEDKVVIGRVGFREMKNGQPFFYVTSSGFEQICSGHNLRQAKKVLHEQGILIKKEEGSYSYPVMLPTLGKTRCYILVHRSLID